MYLKLYYLKKTSNIKAKNWIDTLKNETKELILKQKKEWKSKKEYLKKSISKAINEFEITSNDYKCSNKCVYYENTCFKEDGCIPEYAPFTGYPFVWIGSKEDIIVLFNKLSDEAKIILEDCAYFWILTDKTDELENEINFIFKRNTIIDWNYPWQNIIYSQLIHLILTPNLVGLSYSLYFIRKKIYDIANGPMGPGSPVLIKGPSGSGKEEVAQLLNELSPRNQPLKSIACGILTESNISLAELYGNAKNAGYGNEKDGYLYQYRDGCILFDDFDAADKLMQEALLRCNSNEPHLPYIFHRYGGGGSDKEKRHTNAWLFFSTNRDIDQMINKGELREDFFFRFGARNIELKPLNERYADIPAIIRYVWQELSPPNYYILDKESLEEILKKIPKFNEDDKNIRDSLRSLLINSMIINSNDLIHKMYNIIYHLDHKYKDKKFVELEDKKNKNNENNENKSIEEKSEQNFDIKSTNDEYEKDKYENEIFECFEKLVSDNNESNKDVKDLKTDRSSLTKEKAPRLSAEDVRKIRKKINTDNKKNKKEVKDVNKKSSSLSKEEGPRLSAEDVRTICKKNINWKGNVRDVKRLLWYYFRKKKEGIKKVISIETFLEEVINKKRYFESCGYINVNPFDSLEELVDNVLKKILTPKGQNAFISIVQELMPKESVNATLEDIKSKVSKENINRVKRLIYLLEYVNSEGKVSKKDKKNINGFKNMSKRSSTYNTDINFLKDKKLVVASTTKAHAFIKGNGMFVN